MAILVIQVYLRCQLFLALLILLYQKQQGLQQIDECKQLGIKMIWLQPGADKPAVLAKAKEVGLDYIQDCVLVQLP